MLTAQDTKWIAAVTMQPKMDFESAAPSIVKCVRQRDLLNHWLRLFAAGQALPTAAMYRPERLSEEWSDLVYYHIDSSQSPLRLVIDSSGTRMSRAYGTQGKGRYLDNYLGPILGPVVLPAYHACIAAARPVYTVSMIDDVNGHLVAYERMLMPFGDGSGRGVSHIIASLKTISEDGHFEIRNLMRGHNSMQMPKLCAVIDRSLDPRPCSRVLSGDVIEVGRAGAEQS